MFAHTRPADTEQQAIPLSLYLIKLDSGVVD